MFCVHCGNRLERSWLGVGPAPAEDEIAPACSACGYVHYQGPLPVAAAIVRRNGQILLGRPHEAAHHALIAGFPEQGESIEEAAVREIFEETGLRAEVRYLLGSYPGIPGTGIVLVVCVADVVGGSLRRLESELADLAWFDPEQLPDWPASWPLARVFAKYRFREG